MKLLKYLLIGVAAILLLLVIAVAVFMSSPGLQKSLIMSALEGQPDMEVEIGEIDLDWNGVSASNLRVVTAQKVEASIRSMDLRLAPRLLVDKHAKITRAHMEGIVVDLTQFQPPPETEVEEPEPSGPFEGIFKPIRESGFLLSLDDVKIDGKALLPQGMQLSFTVTGGGVAPGASGQIKSVSHIDADPALTGGVASVESTQVISLTQDDKGLTGIDVTSEVSGRGPVVQGVARVASKLSLQRTQDGETYQVLVNAPGGRELARLDASLAPADSTLSFAYKADVDATAIRELGLTDSAPQFALVGDGKGTVNLKTLAGEAAGTLGGSFVAPTQPGGPQLPQVSFDARFDARGDGEKATLASLLFNVKLGQDEVLKFVLPEPLTLVLADPLGSLPRGTRLADLRLNLPLTGYDACTAPTRIGAGTLRGHFVVSVDGQTLQLTSPEAFGIFDLDIEQPGQPPLKDLDITMSPKLTVSPERVEFSIAPITGRAARSRFLNGELGGSLDLVDDQPRNIAISGKLTADLDVLYGLMMPVDPGKQGTLETKLSLSMAGLDAPLDASLSATLKGVKPEAAEKPLEQLTADLTVQRAANGLIGIKAPVMISGPAGKSNLVLDGTVSTGEGVEFNLNLDGKAIFVSDLQLLAAAYAPPPADEEPAEETPAPESEEPEAEPDRTPDTQPVWAGVKGSFRANINRIVANEQELTNLKVNLRISEAAVELQEFSASFLGNPATARFRLSFGQPTFRPYTLDASFNVQDFDIATVDKAMRKDEKDAKPLMEGLFDISTTVSGSGPNLGTVTEWVGAQVVFTADNAVYHPLGNVGFDSGLVSRAGSLAGRLLQNNEHIRSAAALEQVFEILEGVQANRVEVDILAQNMTDVAINQFLIVTPELMFSGSGRVEYKPELPLRSQPLVLDMQMAAQGNAARQLNQLKLLDPSGKRNERGYWLGPAYTTGGTVSDPTSSLGGLLKSVVTSSFSGKRLDDPELQFTAPAEEEPAAEDDSVEQKAVNALKGLFGT